MKEGYKLEVIISKKETAEEGTSKYAIALLRQNTFNVWS